MVLIRGRQTPLKFQHLILQAQCHVLALMRFIVLVAAHLVNKLLNGGSQRFDIPLQVLNVGGVLVSLILKKN